MIEQGPHAVPCPLVGTMKNGGNIMVKIVTIDNVKVYGNAETSILFMNIEDVANKIGLIHKATSGNIVVRWDRIRKMIDKVMSKYGSNPIYAIDSDKIDKDTYASKELVYMIAMMANNDKARNFQNEIANVIIPGFLDLNPNYEGQSTIMNTVTKAQGHIKGLTFSENPSNKGRLLSNKDRLLGMAIMIADIKKIPIQFVIRDFVDKFNYCYNADIMKDKKDHYLKKNKRGAIVESTVFEYIGTEDDATEKAIGLLRCMYLEVENDQLRNQIFYMSRDIESLKSQLQYFIDAANRDLKIIAYKTVK